MPRDFTSYCLAVRRVAAISAVAAVTAVGIAGCGGSDSPDGGATADQAALNQALPDPIPTRTKKANVVAPEAGQTAEDAALEEQVEEAPKAVKGEKVKPEDVPARQRPVDAAVSADGNVDLASAPSKGGDDFGVGDGDDAVSKATVLKNGIALPPLEAPEAVRKIIEAGNQIARTPYLWGGGHGKWLDKGYDCSGSVSYALHGAGLLEQSMPSGGFTNWGDPGEGQWVTLYANSGHIYMVVAGLRFDTSGRTKTGSRWQTDMRSASGYTVRHPPGL